MTRKPNKLPFFGGGDDESKPSDDDALQKANDFQADQARLNTLVNRSIAGLETYRQSLSQGGSPETFTNRANWLTNLAEELQECKNDRNNPLYRHIHRTNQRRNDLQRAITAAGKAAALFERYATGSRSYVRTDAQIALTNVITTLRSLRS